MIGAQHNTKHRNSVTALRHAVLECQKASQSLRRARRKSSQNHLSGGKWVRLQEHKRSAARLAKSNPCSAYVGENTFRPASWVRLQLCKLCAAQLVKSNPCSAVEFLRQRRRKYARSRVQLPMRTSPHRERGRKPPLFQTRAQRSGSRLKRACQNDMRANAAIAQGIRPAQRINCASG